MDLGIRGRVAIVTGAASGIGYRTCERLAEEGVRVAATDVQTLPAVLLRRVEEAGGTGQRLDVTDPSAWTDLMTVVQERYGRLDFLVNNAGTIRMRNLETMTLEDWRAEHAVNLDGVFLGTQAAIRMMKATGGAVVNVASVAAMVGIHTAPAYCSSKGGVRAFSKAAAMYCAQRGYDIRINSVHPGYIDTPMVQGLLGQSRDPEQMRAVLAEQSALGRLGTVDDVAMGILYLCGTSGRFVTGTELVIDGGYLAR